MLNRYIRVPLDFTRQQASRSAAWVVFARDTISGFVTTAHHALMMLGIVAIGALALMFFKPGFADRLKQLSPFTKTEVKQSEPVQHELASLLEAPAAAQSANAAKAPAYGKVSAATDEKNIGNPRQQQWVTDWLSRRYRVAADATNMLVSAAYLTAREIKLDPLLILSVMAIESGFNPFAESPVGAQGLMQVMSKVHHDKFQEMGGVKAALNPVANIRVGSLILKDYVTRGGSVEAGLKLYVGAGAFENDSGYGARVLAEYRRLKEVANGKKVPIYSTTASTAPAKPQLQDKKADASVVSSDAATAKTESKTEQLAAI